MSDPRRCRQRVDRSAEQAIKRYAMSKIRIAKYSIGQVVRHRLYPFRGVVFDIDPVFNNTEEW